jgi:hypothetical protein
MMRLTKCIKCCESTNGAPATAACPQCMSSGDIFAVTLHCSPGVECPNRDPDSSSCMAAATCKFQVK